VQTIPQHSVTRDTCSRSKGQISYCNNSAVDCPISLKFSTVFDHGTADTHQMFKVKGQRSRSRGQSSRSQRNVTYQQEKRYKTATDRLNDFKLGTCDELKRIGTAWRRAASSCNAFAIATFSSWPIDLPYPSPNFYRGSKIAQILHRVWAHDARSTTKVQGQGVKDQGHSETYNYA